MSESGDITSLVGDLETRLGAKLGLRRGSFGARMRKAGRRLPRRAHRDAKVIEKALEMEAHPKLRRRIDQARVNAAHARISERLDQIDPRERRIRFVLGVLSGLAFNLLLLTALGIAFLKWQGLI